MNNKHLFYISSQSIRILDLKIDFQREIRKKNRNKQKRLCPHTYLNYCLGDCFFYYNDLSC